MRTPSPHRPTVTGHSVSWSSAVLLVSAVALVAPSVAAAQAMNVTLARLRTPAADDTACPQHILAPGGGTSSRDFCGDNAAWGGIANQLGVSMAPPMLVPAGTLGPAAFYVGLEGWITNISGGRQFWRTGTEGDAQAASDGENRFAATALYWQRLQIRKSFPLGFELGTSMAHLFGTTYWSLGFDIKWSILEGFRTGGQGFIPELAVRGAVQTLLGESEFNLTIPSVEVILSKRIVIASAGTITPYIAVQNLWVLGDSELVDLTPQQDAATGGVDDFNNNFVFEQIRTTRLRGALGIQGRYGVLTITGAVVVDFNQIDDPTVGNELGATSDELARKLPRQWTANFGLGASF